MNPGIVIATSQKEPEKAFVFSSFNGDDVWKIHFEMLMKGKHPNKRLQDHLKKNPTDNFDVRLLYSCNKNEFVHYTQHFIESLKPYFNNKSKAKK